MPVSQQRALKGRVGFGHSVDDGIILNKEETTEARNDTPPAGTAADRKSVV